MTAKEQQALINKLGAASNRAFVDAYTQTNRKWFLRKILDFLLSLPTADDQIENSVNVLIKAATKAVSDLIKSGFSAGSLAKKWKLYNQEKSRTQIIYGVIAMNPRMIDPANVDYLKFIVERRFRSLQRMNYFVNPNKDRRVFGYPSKACGSIMKLNDDALASAWKGDAGGTLPFILTASGKASPKASDELLFNVKPKPCERNLLACDPVATIMHMDALAVAKNADTFLKALVAVGDHYLKIDHPFGHFASHDFGQRLVGVASGPVVGAGSDSEIPVGKIGQFVPLIKNVGPGDLSKDEFLPVSDTAFFMIVLGDDHGGFQVKSVNPVQKKIRITSLSKPFGAGAKIYLTRKDLDVYKTLVYHFVTDSRPGNALFEQVSVKTTDLQVGDHVYAINHPLYLMYYPVGSWGGEHSFIFEIESRDIGDKLFSTQLKLAGHGLALTLVGMVNDMLTWINTVLSRLQAVTLIHLANLKANGRKSASGVTFTPPATGGPQVNFFGYKAAYSYMEFDTPATAPTKVTAGFVIKEDAADFTVFTLHNSEGSDPAVTPTATESGDSYAVFFLGTTFSTEQFTPSKWGVKFYNRQTTIFDSMPLFAADNKTPRLLDFNDIAKSKPFLLMDDAGDAFVTRPRVSLDAAYQTFLKNNGAI